MIKVLQEYTLVLHSHVGHPLESKTLPNGQWIRQTGPHIWPKKKRNKTVCHPSVWVAWSLF